MTFFLFVDGFGVPADPEVIGISNYPVLSELTGNLASMPAWGHGFSYQPLDATLGVEGLPQSGTGQTTILTGVNAVELLGYHQGPFPGPTLKALLSQKSLQVWANQQGMAWHHGNAYAPRYLEVVASAQRHVPLSGFGFAALAGGKELLPFGHPLALVPEQLGAAQAWLQNIIGFDLVFYDYWLLDHAGHRAPERIPALLADLEAFLQAFTNLSGDHALVLVSDHGNAEEPAHKSHTLNPVPLVVLGLPAKSMGSLLEVAGWFQAAIANDYDS